MSLLRVSRETNATNAIYDVSRETNAIEFFKILKVGYGRGAVRPWGAKGKGFRARFFKTPTQIVYNSGSLSAIPRVHAVAAPK